MTGRRVLPAQLAALAELGVGWARSRGSVAVSILRPRAAGRWWVVVGPVASVKEQSPKQYATRLASDKVKAEKPKPAKLEKGA